jgi:hypothetical protein
MDREGEWVTDRGKCESSDGKCKPHGGEGKLAFRHLDLLVLIT